MTVITNIKKGKTTEKNGIFRKEEEKNLNILF